MSLSRINFSTPSPVDHGGPTPEQPQFTKIATLQHHDGVDFGLLSQGPEINYSDAPAGPSIPPQGAPPVKEPPKDPPLVGGTPPKDPPPGDSKLPSIPDNRPYGELTDGGFILGWKGKF